MSPVEIPDLWSDDIKVDVLPPLVILKAQDVGISRRTNGIIRAEVVTSKSGQGDAAVYLHSLDLYAPAVNYREQMLTVQHNAKRVYPATITVPDPIEWQEQSNAKSGTVNLGPPVKGNQKMSSIVAGSSEKLVVYLKAALQSPEARALIDSLLALSYEVKRRMPTGEPDPD